MKSLLISLIILSTSSCFDYSRNMVDGKLEPPEPGFFENDKTIGGIDSNNDGVRDDIERWINREFPGEENYNKRMAWKQYAKLVRSIQLNHENEKKLNMYFYEWNDASVCTFHLYYISKEPHEDKVRISDEIIEKSNNIDIRVKAWRKADLSFAGKSHTLPPFSVHSKSCSFKLHK